MNTPNLKVGTPLRVLSTVSSRQTASTMGLAPEAPSMADLPEGLHGKIEIPGQVADNPGMPQTDIQPAPEAPRVVEDPGAVPEGAPGGESDGLAGNSAIPSSSSPASPDLSPAPADTSAPASPAPGAGAGDQPLGAMGAAPAPAPGVAPAPAMPAPAAPGAAPATPAPGAAPGATAGNTTSLDSMKALPLTGPLNPDQVKLAAVQALQSAPGDQNMQKTVRDFVIFMADASFKANQAPGPMAANGRALVQLFQDQELLSALGNPQAFARQLPIAQGMANGQSPVVPGAAPAAPGSPAPGADGIKKPDLGTPGGETPAADGAAPATPPADGAPPAGGDAPPADGAAPAPAEDRPAAPPSGSDADGDGVKDSKDDDADGDGQSDDSEKKEIEAKDDKAPPFAKESAAVLCSVKGLRVYASSSSRETSALTWEWFNSLDAEKKAEYLRLHPMSVFNHPELNPAGQ